MMSSLLAPSCVRMVSLRRDKQIFSTDKPGRWNNVDSYILGIDEDDEHEEEDKEGVSLLEVRVPKGLGNFRKAVTGKQTTHLRKKRF